MKKTLAAGLSAEVKHRVVTENLVSHRWRGAPPVLSTPALLQVMEAAARQAIQPHIDAGEVSLGVGVHFEHLAPTPCGDLIVATATVTAVDGHRVTFDIEARDSREPIACGTHVRAVVDRQRFQQRVMKKTRA